MFFSKCHKKRKKVEPCLPDPNNGSNCNIKCDHPRTKECVTLQVPSLVVAISTQVTTRRLRSLGKVGEIFSFAVGRQIILSIVVLREFIVHPSQTSLFALWQPQLIQTEVLLNELIFNFLVVSSKKKKQKKGGAACAKRHFLPRMRREVTDRFSTRPQTNDA